MTQVLQCTTLNSSLTSSQWRQSLGCQPSPGAAAAPSPPGGSPGLCSATPPAAAGLQSAADGDGKPGGRVGKFVI